MKACLLSVQAGPVSCGQQANRQLQAILRPMSTTFSETEAAAIVRALRERRTTGPLRFDPKLEPDHGIVRDAIESARWAPNHKRTEPWRFYLLGPEQISGMADVNAERMRLANAKPESVAAKHDEWSSVPGMLVLMCQHAKEHDEILRQENYAACAAAAQNFQLHLFAHGIAAKWSTAANWDVAGFWPLLGLQDRPANCEPVGIFSYGIPASSPTAMRNLELQDVMIDLRG